MIIILNQEQNTDSVYGDCRAYLFFEGAKGIVPESISYPYYREQRCIQAPLQTIIRTNPHTS